ncbi:hypothetical protein M8J75_013288 [Diaphorina citri]|nr:hypothetical protein M8J75_013288 [Diaphorina citri]KAI5746745.1 hypothetical protein M8J77_007031 [Diaphorina citri]
MNTQSFTLAERLIPATYLQQAAASKRTRENLIRTLIEHKKWPEEGWDDSVIELFLNDLSQMDSNNFPGNSGVGERESRFASALVARRHFRMGHGIGRSGDIGEVQPKAAGSSLLIKLANALLLDTIRVMGVNNSAGCFLVPMATGMSLVLCMLTIKQDRPGAKFVLWSRIDQKACFKSIITAGLHPIVIETLMSGDELRTDLVSLESQMATLGSDNIVCVLTTTSCFAPRVADNLDPIAALCQRYNIPHVINNAYGLQSTRLMKLIQEAARKGRVDCFVQSTDKNFLVPVGGSIISGFDKSLLEKIAKNYPGRASASPAMDVFITLLSLGINGYKHLISQRKEMYKYMREELQKVATKHGERLLETKNNPISIGMTLSSLGNCGDPKRISMLGSMLFLRSVSGARVITSMENREVCGYKFEGWGAHHANYPFPYITAAAAIGVRKSDVDHFTYRLDKALAKIKGKSAPPTPTSLDDLPPSSGRSARSGRSVNGEGSSAGGEGSSASTSLASSKDSLRK